MSLGSFIGEATMRSFLQVAILFSFVLGCPFAQASALPRPGEFSIEGEILYVHPIVEQTYFVRAGTFGVPTAKRINNELPWRPAYRLTGIYAFCNGLNDFEIRGTYLKASHTRHQNTRQTGDFLEPTQGLPLNEAFEHPSFSDSHLRTRYWAVEGLLGQLLHSYCPFELRVQAGVHYADIQYREILQYRNTTTPDPLISIVTNKDHFWGIGPELAFDMQYALTSYFNGCHLPLHLTGNFRTALLIGKSKPLFDQINDGESFFNAEHESIWRLVPSFDLRFGLSYKCAIGHLEIGYEVMHYNRALHKVTFHHDVVNVTNYAGSEDFYDHFSWHGPYLLLGVSF